MERKIEINPGEELESAVHTLLEAKARGEHVYCDFNGHELHSDSVTMDSAYIEVLGCTKAEWDQKEKEMHENFEKEEKARKNREEGYVEKAKSNRKGEEKAITLEEVVSGLKFIAEHQSMSQEELIEGLLELGCDFSLKDIKQQFPTEIALLEGMKKGDVACGASIIVNVRDNEFGRAYCDDRFLSVDDEDSLYNFIRVATGDETYTKEYVDALNSGNRKHI